MSDLAPRVLVEVPREMGLLLFLFFGSIRTFYDSERRNKDVSRMALAYISDYTKESWVRVRVL
jgi:hypothetical protein